MELKILGKTGIKSSPLIYGTWYLPNMPSPNEPGKRIVDKESSIRLIKKAYDLGINFFDTADVYRGVYDRENLFNDFSTVGQAEKILGEALNGYERESFVISTKVMGRVGPLPNDQGLNRKHIFNAIDKSLERLKMKYVDFYLYHAPDNYTDPAIASKTMNKLIDDGKILHYGLSNFSNSELKRYIEISTELGLEVPVIIQDKLNLLEQKNLSTVIRTAEENKMVSMIYSPLAQGILAGRYIKGDESNSRKEYEKNFKGNALFQQNSERIMKLYDLSVELGIPMSVLSLKWVMTRGENIFPIIGASRVEQVEEDFSVLNIKIDNETIEKIDNIFKS